MQEQLKVCPACGSAELGFGVSESDLENYREAMIWVECSFCDTRGPAYPDMYVARKRQLMPGTTCRVPLNGNEPRQPKRGFIFTATFLAVCRW